MTTIAEDAPVAILPMYDWPEVRTATDALWASMRETLRAAGIAAPDRLSRVDDPEPLWRAPSLAVGQTCGLPYVTRLRDAVGLLGAPDFALDGCPPGHYRSAIVIRADDARDGLDAFVGARPAMNAHDSQSGHAALAHTLADFGGMAMLGAPLVTGAHRASIRAVATGRADIAAIDAVTWRLAIAHEGTASELRVLAWTDPTPGLPYISAPGTDVDLASRAVAEGIAALDAKSAEALGVTGFVRFADADYDIIAERYRQVAGSGLARTY